MFEISTEKLNELLKYLGTRPYGEVFQLIQMLASLEKIEEEKPAKNPRKK